MVIDGGVLMKIWDFIAGYVAQHGRPPSQREIAAGIDGISRSNVFRYLDILAEMGVVEYSKGVHRGVRIVLVPAKFDWAAAEQEHFLRTHPHLAKHLRRGDGDPAA